MVTETSTGHGSGRFGGRSPADQEGSFESSSKQCCSDSRGKSGSSQLLDVFARHVSDCKAEEGRALWQVIVRLQEQDRITKNNA